MKGKIVNFEWLRDGNHYSFDEFELIKYERITQELASAAAQGCNLVIGIYLMDGFLPFESSYFVDHINEIRKIGRKQGIERIIILSGHGEHIQGLDDYVFLDYTLRMTYNAYKDSPEQSWNPDSYDFLLLGGSPSRPNRIGLFSKFYDKKLFDNAVWTFFAPWADNDKTYCRNYLRHYNDSQYDAFIKFCDRSLDNKYTDVKPFLGDYTNAGTDISFYDIVEKEWTKNIAYIEPLVFQQTCVSVITEGPNYWNDRNSFITEKTWRTIMLNHPFIFAGHPDQFRYLKLQGFKTFDDFMLIKDYAYIEDEDERLDAIVTNTEYFIANKNSCINEIQKDIEYNSIRLKEIINKQNRFLDDLENQFSISREDINYYVEKTGYDQLIRNPKNEI